jgi:hypothetical protein
VPRPCQLLFAVVLTGIAQGQSPARASLQITSPAAGTVVNPGQTIPIYVSTSGGSFAVVAVGGDGVIPDGQLLRHPPYQFSVTIPSQIRLGLYSLVAVGSMGSGNPTFSHQVSIDVERADAPQSITTDLSTIDLPIGGRCGVRVLGTYSDGSTLDLSRSTQTVYEATRKGVVSITKEGLVTGLALGSTDIVIEHRGSKAAVKAAVSRSRE